MAHLSILDWISLAGGALSILALAYSLLLLTRTGQRIKWVPQASGEVRTRSLSLTPINFGNPVLRLLALSDPAVKKLLSPPWEKVTLQVRATSEGQQEATLTADRGTTADCVVIDLVKRKELVPLIEGLRTSIENDQGGSLCLTHTKRSQRRKRNRRPRGERGQGSEPAPAVAPPATEEF